MLPFGHIGITTGAFKAGEFLSSASRHFKSCEPDSGSRLNSACPFRFLNVIKNRVGPIDYRLVWMGSLLPDILDKPLWYFTTFGSGRDFSHTLLFNLVLFISGLILVTKYSKSWLLIISLSSFVHLILDQIWNNPATLLWPLRGQFPRLATTSWLPDTLHKLTSDAGTYIPEIIGLIIILAVVYRLITRRKLTSFIRTGAID